jgi:hypothetical protein
VSEGQLPEFISLLNQILPLLTIPKACLYQRLLRNCDPATDRLEVLVQILGVNLGGEVEERGCDFKP